ncbi:host attachment family protein [Parasphingorhabdus sp.]|uniref:host attachment family protein n=1 Tax=Parasphingorhabdus sp. TaxID=2709688 RepID=UPI003A920816
MGTLNFPEDTFVVVATGEEAKTFYVDGGSLKSNGDWTPGNLADQGPSGKSPPERSAKESMEATFSKIMAEKLYELSHKGAYDRLILVADPETLGEMRPLLHKEVTDKIVLEQAKTLTNSPVKDIEKSISQ